MTAQRKSQPRSTRDPNPSTNTAPTDVPAPSTWAAGAYQRCGPACVRPTPTQAHCAARSCHRTFGGVSGFDAHRRNGECLHPEEIGMVRNDSGIWRTPMTDEDRARRFPPTPDVALAAAGDKEASA